MYGPLSLVQGWSADAEYVAAFVIGSAFGFFLEQGGFGNARKLALTFYLRDMTVVKVMFSAIVTAMLGMVLLAQLGALDLERVWLNPTYLWPGIVGGVIVIILLIVATLTLSYLMRRPSSTGEGITRATTPAAELG